MPNVKNPRVLIALILGITTLLTSLFGALYLYRFSQNLRAESTKQALLSAQIFAESLSPDEPSRQLLMTTQTFVQGDVLYAQVVRDGKVSVEKHAEASLELELPVEAFSGRLVHRESRLKDGTPYLDILRPFTGESVEPTGTTLDYVRVGFSLGEMNSLLNAETLTVIEVGFLIIIAAMLLCGLYWFVFLKKTVTIPRGFPTEHSPDQGEVASALDHAPAHATLLHVDPASKEVSLRGARVDLSPKEYDLVCLLSSEPGRVFSTREILDKVWAEGDSATDKDVKQYIYLLRKKLEVDPEHPQVIVTVRGFGYKLLPKDQPSAH